MDGRRIGDGGGISAGVLYDVQFSLRQQGQRGGTGGMVNVMR